jgi:hypothetical protein
VRELECAWQREGDSRHRLPPWPRLPGGRRVGAQVHHLQFLLVHRRGGPRPERHSAQARAKGEPPSALLTLNDFVSLPNLDNRRKLLQRSLCRGVCGGGWVQGKAPIHHWFPLRIALCGHEWNLMQPWEMGEPFMRNISWGILNYVVLKPLMTAITLVLQVWGLYGDGEFSAHRYVLASTPAPTKHPIPSVVERAALPSLRRHSCDLIARGYPYILFINNFSQCWALYCLVLLYEATAEELAPLKPLAKFLCVKGVVFFTFWQQAMLTLLSFFHVFTLNHRWECYTNTHDMINGIQVRAGVLGPPSSYSFRPAGGDGGPFNSCV